MSLTLGELLERGAGRAIVGEASTEVRGVRHDSREVEPGDLFVALLGEEEEGARYLAQAVERGAAAVATERPLELPLPQLVVEDARASLGHLAAEVHGHPTRSLTVVGLTGTNGKTTTAWLLEQALRHLGRSVALMGTVELRGPGGRRRLPFTTPEGDEIARFARGELDAGATHLVMEVSSHGLALARADAVDFDVAAFLNLSQDHLDFHPSMEEYFEAKARLFRDLSPRRSVICVDGEHGRRLAAALLDEGREGVVRVRSELQGPEAEIYVRSQRTERSGLRAEVVTPEGPLELRSPLIGAHNLQNLVVAIGCLLSLGEPVGAIEAALVEAQGAPGRLQRVPDPRGTMVLVDYAHTPDALARALAALRPLTPGRLLAVFGCGGDRDRAKRPKMGAAAARGADAVILTSDNPRTEDPMAILAEIEPGVRAEGLTKIAPEAFCAGGGVERRYAVIEPRREAIRRALAAAGPEDTVLIAGKGHEDYQIVGKTRHRFDDVEEAAAAIASLVGEEG